MNDRIHKLFIQAKSREDTKRRWDALSGLVAEFAGTNNYAVNSFLGSIVCDDTEEPEYRLAAYICMFEVAGRALSDIGFINNFKIPDSFDMSFLNQYLTEGEHSGPSH
jgi:hypothetical protein